MSLQALAGAIDDLRQVDPRSLTDDELQDIVVSWERERDRLIAAEAPFLAEWESRRTWADDGSKSPRCRMARDCGSDKRSAGRSLKRARKLRDMPVVAAAFAEGRLSADMVDLLVNSHTVPVSALFARDEEMLVKELEWMRYDEALRYLERWRQVADHEADVKRRERHTADRHAHADRTFRGGIHISGFLPTLEGTAFLLEFHRLQQLEYEKDLAVAREEWGDEAAKHLPRTARQRGADALIEMAKRSAAMPAGRRLPVPLFTVLTGHDTARQALCQLEDGTVLNPAQMIPYMTEADFERIVFAGPNRVIEVGARTRFFIGALRRLIQVRDRYCQHPSGCDEPLSRCQVDHVHEYEDGGETTQENGQLQCGFHNRWKHRRKRPTPPE